MHTHGQDWHLAIDYTIQYTVRFRLKLRQATRVFLSSFLELGIFDLRDLMLHCETTGSRVLPGIGRERTFN